jgi:hypothetical protein
MMAAPNPIGPESDYNQTNVIPSSQLKNCLS